VRPHTTLTHIRKLDDSIHIYSIVVEYIFSAVVEHAAICVFIPLIYTYGSWMTLYNVVVEYIFRAVVQPEAICVSSY
jgi:hypothetical protein